MNHSTGTWGTVPGDAAIVLTTLGLLRSLTVGPAGGTFGQGPSAGLPRNAKLRKQKLYKEQTCFCFSFPFAVCPTLI